MTRLKSWQGVRVWTVGHSTRPFEAFVGLLTSFEIGVLADIRTVPRSRKNPQFNADALPSALAPYALEYAHLPRLGGLRHARKDSQNTGWRNESFRGYADYLLTAEFEIGLAELRVLAEHGRVALMCAEAVPWRCHRSLIADALQVRGIPSAEIVGPTRLQPHRLTPFAHVHGTVLTYPPPVADPTGD